MKRKLAKVMLVNTALVVVGITIGIGMAIHDKDTGGIDGQVAVVVFLSAAISSGVLAAANLLVGFFTVLATATLEVSEVRGWGKAMLLGGVILPLCGIIFYGLLVLASILSYGTG